MTNNKHSKIIHEFNYLQISYLRRTALNISSSAYFILSNEYATSKNDV
jgi:hypothetical protein